MKCLNNRHAFTMMELIFILIVIGILAAVIIPKSRDTRLREGADQIVSHIRYTQHLAMMNDVFAPNDGDWYKKRWQIMFWQDGGSWIYTIFSDTNADGGVSEAEIAINPQDSSRRLIGFAPVGVPERVITKDLNIGKTYGVSSVTFTNCKNDIDSRIFFDYLGRPMSGNPSNPALPYDSNYLIMSATPLCTITITNNSGGSLNVTIQPETGFAKIE